MGSINWLVNDGKSDKEFMPATPGMGTQVVCKISNRSPPSSQMASDPKPRAGNVKEVIEELIKKQAEKKKKGQALTSKDLDMLRAQIPFDTRGQIVEFMDVPGIKDATKFHSALALGLATSMILVCGTPNDMKTQLDSGDLPLLVDICEKQKLTIPIHCLSSYFVNEKDFTDEYKKK